MEGIEDMEDTDIMERDLLRLMLSQDTLEEVMDMAVDTMAREKLKPSQDILEVMVVMVIAVDMEDMAMDVDTMARGRLTLKLGILEDMVDMVEDMDMAVMVMAMDMVDMVEDMEMAD